MEHLSKADYERDGIDGFSKISAEDLMSARMSLSIGAYDAYFRSSWSRIEFIKFIGVNFDVVSTFGSVPAEPVIIDGRQCGVLYKGFIPKVRYYVFVYGIGSRFLKSSDIDKLNKKSTIVFGLSNSDYRINQDD